MAQGQVLSCSLCSTGGLGQLSPELFLLQCCLSAVGPLTRPSVLLGLMHWVKTQS